jgi:nucleoside-diphosphate-sugar epimerase
MRILVTGGCGFIGHNVVERLQQEGHQVRIIDNQTSYGIIPHDELNYLMYERKKKFEYDTMVHEINIDNSSVTSDIIFDLFMPEIVIHLASMPRQKIVNNNPIRGSDVMIGGLLSLLESSIKHEVKKFVYISSSMVYGDFTDDVKENAECNPQGAYAIMKYTGEQLVKDYTRRYQKSISHTIIRPSAVYGPLDIEDRVVSKFLLGAMRGEVLKVYGPEERLDFTYIEDVVEGIVDAALSENTKNKTYNITRSQSITLLEAAQYAINLAGQGSIQVHERDLGFPSRGSLNIYAAKRDFDYSPFVDFKDGLIEYHSWLYNSPYWRKKLSL